MLLYRYERKGIFVLIVLITCLFLLPRLFLKGQHDLQFISIQENREYAIKKDTVIPLELNTADSTALVQVRGIGPYYAARILNYRKRLGGFYSVDQLKEIKMTYFNVDSLSHLFRVNRNYILKRELDQMTFKEILSHPYLEYEDVKMIMNAKRKYGAVSFDTLKIRGILPDYKLRKIRYYFK